MNKNIEKNFPHNLNLLRICLISVFLFFLVSCQATQNTVTNQETSNQLQISEPILNGTKKNIDTQVILLDNCDGSTPTIKVSRSLEKEQTQLFFMDSELNGSISTDLVPEIVQLTIQAKIDLALEKRYTQSYQESYQFDLVAPTGTKKEITLYWEEEVATGSINLFYGSDLKIVNFESLINISMINKESVDLSCNFSDLSLQETSEPLPTNTVFPTLTTYPLPTQTNEISQINFEVFSNKSWQNTGIIIEQGQNVQIEYISGEWTAESSAPGMGGPEGGYADYATAACYPIKNEGPSLIGRIGNTDPFKIGYIYYDSSTISGPLFLRINDCDSMISDNAGSLIVKIEIQ